MSHNDDRGWLWAPTTDSICRSNMAHFSHFIAEKHGISLKNYDDLYDWSVQNYEDFWDGFWDWSGIIGDKNHSPVHTVNTEMWETRFFPDAFVNYAENLLGAFQDDQTMMVFRREDGTEESLTAGTIKTRVAAVRFFLENQGIKGGDCIAGYLPNMPDTIIVMLASASLGVIWTACSPDFGIAGAYDRLDQVKPRLLFCVDRYLYGGKSLDMKEKNEQLRQLLRVPLIEVSYDGGDSALSKIYENNQNAPLTFDRTPFNHPLFILFSSGTTGIPKCMVHGHGGTLIQHLKEHRLHSDIMAGDRVFFYTTCSWMMWHWTASALASGAAVYLYDGSPFYPGSGALWDYAADHQITHMGISAKYIDSLQKSGFSGEKHDLSSLKMIWSTGSPLSASGFDYVYKNIPGDFCLASISGGSDIISCFALGNPIGPVYAGELQTRGLGMAVDIYNEDRKPLRGEKGELVCTAPFPSQPLMFWGQDGIERYKKSYFNHFPGIWHHGDYGEMTAHGGLIISGRSDATLNPGGVRIGTADIYRQVEKIPEIAESIVVGQDWKGDCRIVLFVRLAPGAILTDSLKKAIQSQIRTGETSHHVPSVILSVPDIPKTHNGKIAELAVRNIIHGRPVSNKESLANPDCLDFFRLPDGI